MASLKILSSLVIVILLAGAFALTVWMLNRPASAPPPVAAAQPAAENQAPPTDNAPVREAVQRVSVSVSPARIRDGRPPEIKIQSVEFSAEVPAVVVGFDRWAHKYAAASPEERSSLLAEGRALVSQRTALIGQLIAESPEAAILFTPPPAVRDTLPPEIAASLEKVIAAKGFYGVKAICNHGPDVPHSEQGCRIEYEAGIGDTFYKASIYGTRRERLTEENASLYGVALDGLIALHEDDYVVLPGEDLDPSRAGQLALIHNGETTWFPDRAAIQEHFESPSRP